MLGLQNTIFQIKFCLNNKSLYDGIIESLLHTQLKRMGCTWIQIK